MVSAQQEANSLFLKSDTDRMATPSEHPEHCDVAYPQMASAKSAFFARFQRFHEGRWLSGDYSGNNERGQERR